MDLLLVATPSVTHKNHNHINLSLPKNVPGSTLHAQHCHAMCDFKNKTHPSVSKTKQNSYFIFMNIHEASVRIRRRDAAHKSFPVGSAQNITFNRVSIPAPKKLMMA